MAPSAIAGVTCPEPVSRSSLYALLAVGFRYPTQERFAAFTQGSYQAELSEWLERVPHLAEVAPDAANPHTRPEHLSIEEFQTEYVVTFDTGVGEPPCPPYEGSYRDQERTAVMLRVSSFYKHFGLGMSRRQGRREVPDHLCAELEFLHFLSFKEAQAQEEADAELLRGYRMAQRDFLQQHLSQWVPAFTNRLETYCSTPFYADLGRTLTRVVGLELAAVQSRLTAPSDSDEARANASEQRSGAQPAHRPSAAAQSERYGIE